MKFLLFTTPFALMALLALGQPLIAINPSCSSATCSTPTCAANSCKQCVPFNCCRPACAPYPRRLPGDYDSYKDNTKMVMQRMKPCAPRNDSKFQGYLYKGMWWDNTGVRYWAFRNSTNNTITIQALHGGECKDIPAGDVTNIARGESYGFRVQAPACRFELFNNDMHNLEIFINLKGDIDYRVEPLPVKTAKKATNIEKDFAPRF